MGWQKLNHLISHLSNVETCVINMITHNLYFGFCQTFSPTNVCVMTFTETDLSQTSNSNRSWTQEAVNMAAPCWKLLRDWYVNGSGSWKIRNEQKLTSDYQWFSKIHRPIFFWLQTVCSCKAQVTSEKSLSPSLRYDFLQLEGNSYSSTSL